MSEPLVHLIDDDEAVRASVSFVLEMNDLPARTYESAVEFLAVAESLKSGCIVTDVRMPEMSGCLLYTSPSPRDGLLSRMPSSA